VPYIYFDNNPCFYRISEHARPDNPPALFIHGSGGDGTVWDRQLQDIAARCTVIVPDLPGHGKSAGPLPSSARQYAHWVRDLAERLDLSFLFLIGHSLGGAIVQEYARAYPDMTAGIVLAASGTRFGTSPEHLRLLEQNFLQAVKISCDRAYGPGVPPRLYQQGFDMLVGNGKETLLADINVCACFDSSPWLGSLAAPALVVCGQDDAITPCDLSREVAANLPGCRVLFVPGAGHMVMQEAPEAFNEAVLGFVEKYCNVR